MTTLALAIAMTGSACSSVCAPVGYISTLTVTVEGPQPDEIELCHDGMCAPSRAASSVGFMVTPPTISGDTWTFTGDFPTTFTVHAYADDGTLLANVDAEPSWHRTGGSARCGGPMQAEIAIRTAA